MFLQCQHSTLRSLWTISNQHYTWFSLSAFILVFGPQFTAAQNYTCCEHNFLNDSQKFAFEKEFSENGRTMTISTVGLAKFQKNLNVSSIGLRWNSLSTIFVIDLIKYILPLLLAKSCCFLFAASSILKFVCYTYTLCLCCRHQYCKVCQINSKLIE